MREIDFNSGVQVTIKPVDTELRESVTAHTKLGFTLGPKDLAKMLIGQVGTLSLCFKIELIKPGENEPWGEPRVTKYSTDIVIHKRGEIIPTKEAVFDDKALHLSRGE